MTPISSWEPSELDKQTQIAQQALARIAALEAENKKAVYGCCEECRALSETEAELAAAIELVTMARQTFDADGNGTRFLSEIRDDVLKDVKRLAKRSTS